MAVLGRLAGVVVVAGAAGVVFLAGYACGRHHTIKAHAEARAKAEAEAAAQEKAQQQNNKPSRRDLGRPPTPSGQRLSNGWHRARSPCMSDVDSEFGDIGSPRQENYRMVLVVRMDLNMVSLVGSLAYFRSRLLWVGKPSTGVAAAATQHDVPGIEFRADNMCRIVLLLSRGQEPLQPLLDARARCMFHSLSNSCLIPGRNVTPHQGPNVFIGWWDSSKRRGHKSPGFVASQKALFRCKRLPEDLELGMAGHRDWVEVMHEQE